VSTITRQAYSYRTDPTVPNFPDDRPVIIFDGYCALCCGWAQFVLRHDRREMFRFLPAQSPLGHALYVHYGLDTRAYETNILLADGLAWFKSESTIRMAEGLGLPWSLAAGFRILPLALRDPLYEYISRNRLRFFGSRETCYIPERRFADRFLG
jgi:predicted DCC family thiol-disulfide oxidoreductase YuxK